MRYGMIVVTLLLGCGGKKDENAATGSGSASGAAAAPAPAAPAPGAGTAPAGGAAPSAAGDDPWQAKGGAPPSGGAVAADDDPAPTPTETGDEPTAATGGGAATAADATRAALIAKWCEKVSTCGCPEENCEAEYAKIEGTTASMYACFNAQSCETACEPNAGASGTTLFNTCMKGKVGAPAGGGGAAGKTCRRSSDCGGGHDCCNGLCYQMGTSLWITACQMPSGKF